MDPEPHKHMPKSLQSAIDYRREGNNRLSQELYHEAFEFFNMSLAFAPPGAEIMALVYNDRSKVYFDVFQDYARSFENILWAEKIRVPDDWTQWREDLQARKRSCRSLKQFQIPPIDSNPFTFFRLSFKANPLYPAVADCLTVAEDNQYGRHIITHKDLKPGDIIVVEDTPFKALSEDGAFVRCANCFKSNRMSLIPLKKPCALGWDGMSQFLIRGIKFLFFQRCFALKSVTRTARINTFALSMRNSQSSHGLCSQHSKRTETQC